MVELIWNELGYILQTLVQERERNVLLWLEILEDDGIDLKWARLHSGNIGTKKGK